MAGGNSKHRFVKNTNGYFSLNPDKPEDDSAFSETWIRQSVSDSTLKFINPVLFGNWSGREGALSFQDIIILEKPGPPV